MRIKVVNRFKASKLRCDHYQNQCNKETHYDESVIGPLSNRTKFMRKLRNYLLNKRKPNVILTYNTIAKTKINKIMLRYINT